MTARILWGTNLENVLEFDRLDAQMSGQPLRGGSEQERPGARGVEDAWSTGYDYQLVGDMRWVDPSLWSGPSGVRDWLDWAAEKNTFRYVPDSTFPDFWVDGCYLASPVGNDRTGAGQLEANEQRRVKVTMRNPTYDFSLARRGLFFEFGPSDAPLPAQLTHTRNGTAAYFGKTPRDLATVPLTRLMAASGVLRDRDYWSTTQRVAMLEGGYSFANLCSKPEELGDAFWSFTDTTVTSNLIDDPNRTAQNADKIVEGTGSAQHTRHFEFSAGASDILSATVYLRAAERTKVQVYFSDSFAGADKMGCQVDLQTLAVSTILSGSGSFRATPKVRSVRAGWVELRFSGVTTTSTTPDFVIRLCDAAGSGTYTGDGTSGLYAWGVMVTKQRSTTSSYYPGNRAKDTVSMSWLWKPQPMWVYLKFIEVGSAAEDSGEGPFRIGLTTQTPKKFLRFDTFTSGTFRYRFSHQDGVSGVSSNMASGTPAIGDTMELLGILNADGSVQIKHSINGAAEVAGSVSSAFALDPSWVSADAAFPLDYSGGFILAKAGRGVAVNTVALARVA